MHADEVVLSAVLEGFTQTVTELEGFTQAVI